MLDFFFLLLGRFAGSCVLVLVSWEKVRKACACLCVGVLQKATSKRKKEFYLLEICATKTNKKIRKEFAPDFCEGEVCLFPVVWWE